MNMSTLASPPDHIREAFRRDLIERRGSAGAFGLGYSEELKRYEFYLNTVEDFISEQEAVEIAALEQDAAKLSEEGKGEFWSYYYPVHWDEIFRSNLRPTFLISLISFIEGQLHTVCRDVEIIARSPISATDLRGGFLEKSRLFLDKFGGFQESDAQIWANVSRIYDVRNVFVHHAGYLPAYNHEKRLRQFIQSTGGLVAGHDYLSLSKDFCPFALRVTEEFFNAVSRDLAALCERVARFESSAKNEP